MALAWLATVPGVATAQPLDPSAVVETSGPVRGVGSFLAVLLVGGVFLYLYRGFVDRSTDAVMERPGVAVLYGLVAYLIVGFLGVYALDLVLRLGVSNTPIALVAPVIPVTGVLVLAGLGFAVVGTLITDLQGNRRPWRGLVLGAAISAATWVVLPPLVAFLAWAGVAAFGIGGTTRRWVHASRDVESGVES